jgi:hypothetical protein
MNNNFVVRGLLSAAIILAIYKSMKNTVRPMVGIIFFAIWGATSFLLGFFITDIPNASLIVNNPTSHGELHLDDGCSVSASPGHHIPDGHVISDLKVGDLLDGAIVVSV